MYPVAQALRLHPMKKIVGAAFSPGAIETRRYPSLRNQSPSRRQRTGKPHRTIQRSMSRLDPIKEEGQLLSEAVRKTRISQRGAEFFSLPPFFLSGSQRYSVSDCEFDVTQPEQ